MGAQAVRRQLREAAAAAAGRKRQSTHLHRAAVLVAGRSELVSLLLRRDVLLVEAGDKVGVGYSQPRLAVSRHSINIIPNEFEVNKCSVCRSLSCWLWVGMGGSGRAWEAMRVGGGKGGGGSGSGGKFGERGAARTTVWSWLVSALGGAPQSPGGQLCSLPCLHRWSPPPAPPPRLLLPLVGRW